MSRVVVSPYSAEWPMRFDAIREELLPVFAPVAATVEHIGSTSIPGLAAKPVIDVLLGARTSTFPSTSANCRCAGIS
jgi:GrpB-like predicted nucleotidyltransferase (UPF0157 family)